MMADSRAEIGGDSHSSPAVLRAAELANGLQMGGEAFWWQKRGAHSWHDFSEGAQWRTTAWSTAAWRNWPNRSMNKLFQKDLCSVLVVHFDLMHCRYLGYLQQLFGSVF